MRRKAGITYQINCTLPDELLVNNHMDLCVEIISDLSIQAAGFWQLFNDAGVIQSASVLAQEKLINWVETLPTKGGLL